MQVDWKRLIFFLAINAVVSVLVASAAFLILRRMFPTTVGGADRSLSVAPTAGTAPGPSTSLAPALDLEHLPTVTPFVYVVEGGDSLGDIAVRFDVPVEDLMAVNGLSDPDVLEVGQTLIIPIGGVAAPTFTPVPTNSPMAPFATATRDPNAAAPNLVIQQVIAPGDLESESVRLTNLGGAVDLAGWTLEDSEGNRYTFPALTLHQNGAVTVHTRAGTNSVIDLYWGAAQAVLQIGETLTLRQPDNLVHTTYTVK